MNARTKTRTPILRLGAMAAALAVAVVILILIAADSEPVSATQPPPPVYYTVTINRSGGGDCTKFYFDAPVITDPSSSSVQRSIQEGVSVWLGIEIECLCDYKFDHWEINGEEVDDGGPHHYTGFTLTEDTTATAFFVKRVPDDESTTWNQHWTTNPHQGDVYAHKVSSSSDPQMKFTGMTINEDFLTSEMVTTGWTLSSQYKEQYQRDWDGDWLIDSNNNRAPADGNDPMDALDAHGFIPTVTPWNAMSDGDTFQLKQRMRVKDPCVSVNNQGPWFKTHSILFKLIVDPQTGAREVFVKKSGVQGPGDPQI